MVFIKRLINADPGNADTLGGDDWDTLDSYFDNTDITPKVATVNTITKYRSTKLRTQNPLNTFSYITVGSAITADRTITEPLLVADDERVYKNHAVTLASKTLASSCDISAVAATTSVKGAVELATDGESASGVVVQGNDARMSNARTPSAHATSHKSGQSDPIKLDELAAPTDVTTLNATTSLHGLLRKLDNNAAHFLDGQGNWSGTAGGLSAADILNIRPALYIPLFIYPNPLDDWQRVADLKALVPGLQIICTMNQNNGDGADNTHPFTARDTDFGNGITILDNAGCKVLGYVYTGYGTRSAAVVKACIDAYVTYYPEVRGIFFDEMDNITGHEAYYADLESYVKTTKGLELTVGNPGATTLASYATIFDTVLVVEGAGMPSEATVIAATLTGAYPRRRFGVIPFNISSFTTYGLRTLLKYAGLMYIQSDTTPNPWDSLPDYLELLAITIGNAQ